MKEKIIARLKDKRSSVKIQYYEDRYYTKLETEIELLEDILEEDFGMTRKEVSEL